MSRKLAVAALAAGFGILGALVPGATAAPRPIDLGDAPDDNGSDRYKFFRGVNGNFPALRRSDGARHTRVGPLRLGLRVNRERDSRQVDLDRFDDGFYPALRACRLSTLIFVVNARRLPAALRRRGHVAYLNAWFDWNRDGDWADRRGCGTTIPEWRVQNLPLDMSRFANDPLRAVMVSVVAGSELNEMWMRASLTLDQRFRSPSVGKGRFRHGETEDYIHWTRVPEQRRRRGRARRRIPDEPVDASCAREGAAFIPHGGFEELTVLVSPPNANPLLQNGIPLLNAGLLVQRQGNTFDYISQDVDPPQRFEIFQLKFDVVGPTGAVKKLVCPVGVFHDETPDGPFTTPQPGTPPPSEPGQPPENGVGMGGSFDWDDFGPGEVMGRGNFTGSGERVDTISLVVPPAGSTPRQITAHLCPQQFSEGFVGTTNTPSDTLFCTGGSVAIGEQFTANVRTNPAPSPGMGGSLYGGRNGVYQGPFPITGP